MADESTKSKKSGRTPEQQAARDARKAAKAAEAEAKAAAAATAAATDDAEAPSSSKRKRTAEEEADMLEIDLGAGTPLSKAEARAARKRAKKGLEPLPKKSLGEEKDAGSGSDDDSGKDGKSHADKPKPQTRGEYSVWIGNLSFRTTADALQEFIERGIEESGGERDCVTRVNLPKKPGKGGFAESKGFAYVDFKTEALQLLAIGLSERPLDGRRLLIKAGNDHKVNPNARTPKPTPSGPGTVPLGKQMHAESSTLFIGNLPFDVAEEELRDLVEGNADGSVDAAADGEDAEEEEDGDEDAEEKAAAPVSSRSGAKSGLVKTRVAQFEDTGRCKGFAFWDFKSPLHARAALMNRKNHYLRGRRLTLQYASETATKRSGGRRNRPEGEERGSSSGRGGRGGHGGHGKRQPRYFEAQEGDDGEGSYERSAPAQGHTPGDLKSEAASQARIAALVAGGGADAHAEPSHAAPERPSKDKRGKKWEATGRPRPGAALAMAKRENVSIVESSGSKIVFE